MATFFQHQQAMAKALAAHLIPDSFNREIGEAWTIRQELELILMDRLEGDTNSAAMLQLVERAGRHMHAAAEAVEIENP